MSAWSVGLLIVKFICIWQELFQIKKIHQKNCGNCLLAGNITKWNFAVYMIWKIRIIWWRTCLWSISISNIKQQKWNEKFLFGLTAWSLRWLVIKLRTRTNEHLLSFKDTIFIVSFYWLFGLAHYLWFHTNHSSIVTKCFSETRGIVCWCVLTKKTACK